MALAEAQLGHCPEALAHLDQYLAATANPSNDAFEILRKCPRGATPPAPVAPPVVTSAPPPPAPPPAPPTPPHKRERLFLVAVELGINVLITSGSPQAAFLGTIELGVALSNRYGLDLVLLAESLVSRAAVNPDGSLATVFSENLLLGLEYRRVLWRGDLRHRRRRHPPRQLQGLSRRRRAPLRRRPRLDDWPRRDSACAPSTSASSSRPTAPPALPGALRRGTRYGSD